MQHGWIQSRISGCFFWIGFHPSALNEKGIVFVAMLALASMGDCLTVDLAAAWEKPHGCARATESKSWRNLAATSMSLHILSACDNNVFEIFQSPLKKKEYKCVTG